MNRNIPLAEQLRAQNLSEIVGQEHILGKEGLITAMIASKKPLSILLWGPPGVGKTSIARLYAREFSLNFVSLSAVNSTTADLKKIIKENECNPLLSGTTLLFMDEIHRFNKAQQDAFLPYLENGAIILIGATTENPSFYLNSALLSRLRVLVLKPLERDALEKLLVKYEERFGNLNLSSDARNFLIDLSDGDGRYFYNLIENLGVRNSETLIDIGDIERIIQRRAVLYDRAGEQHYNLISALHKSVRSSDPDAAIYWFARMIKGGEDPLFLARRLIRIASEDIGLADPQALAMAIAARESFIALGSPEGELAIAQVVIYLALAPKSNAVYLAYKNACFSAQSTAYYPPPKHALNAPTNLMKELNYGDGYIYDHDVASGCSGLNNFPVDLARREFYQPVERGFEREMKKRLDYFRTFRERKGNKNYESS